MTSDQAHFEEVLEGISHGSTGEIKVLLASLRPSEVANVIEANTPDTRRIIWGLIDEEVRNQSLQHLRDDVRAEFFGSHGYGPVSGSGRKPGHRRLC